MMPSKETLKANRKERGLYKKMKLVILLLDQVLANKHHVRQNTRIAFNCKVYEFLDTDCLQELMNRCNLPAVTRKHLKEEYTDSRLNNLNNHILEEESNYFKELANGQWLVPPSCINTLLESCKINWPNFPTGYPELNRLLKKKKNVKSACNTIREFFHYDIAGNQHIQFIESKEVYQFGRSGGWMSVADASEFDRLKGEIEYALEKNFFDDKTIKIKDAGTRSKWWLEIRSYWNCSTEELDCIINKCRAVLWVINEGKEMVKRINKNFLKERLFEDVNEFLKGIRVEITPDQLKKWMDGDCEIRTNRVGYSYLRIDPKDSNFIQTSQGVNIPISEGEALFKRLQHFIENPNRDQIKMGILIGKYQIEEFSKNEMDYVLKAGCHKIPWKHIEEFSRKYLFKG